MKKKIIIYASLFVLFIIIVSLLFLKNKYTISLVKIDNFSPDRKLIVYKNNKEIDYKEVLYLDGVVLCTSKNPTISYSEIVDEKELIIKLNNNKQVKAIIIK